MEPRNPPPAGRTAAASAPRSKYAPRACQECRRRRAKCDGQKPSCARCLSRGKACVFTSEADNRGSAPKSYVALLQARIKLLEKVLWLHSIDVDASIAQLDAQRTEGTTEPSTAAFNDMCADHEGALCLDEPLCELEQPTSEARFFGPTSGRLELQISHGVAVTAESPGFESSPGTEYQGPVVARHHVAPSETGSSIEPSSVDDLVTPGLKGRLIDLYFEWEQPWYQMVDEKLFRQSMQCNGPYSTPLLLCSILAVGSRYSDETQVRSNPDDPNTAGRIFFERAEILLRSDLRSPSITTIQSLGLMGTYYVAIGSDSLGWLHHGIANRVLLEMGFNLDSTIVTGMGSLTPDEMRLRRQIYWSLYCHDKLWASYTGRVCTMLDSQGAVPLPSPTIPNEIHSDSRGMRSQHLPRLQRAVVTHCQILEKILTNLYAPKRLASAAEKRTFFDSCILTLKGWYYSLPKELRVKAADGSNDSAPSPHACILHMLYHTSVVLLAKPFLRYRKRTEAAAGTPQLAEQDDDMFRRASAACLEAAGEICLVAERYRQAFGSFRRSPLTATHCTLTAALVLMFVQPVAAGKIPPRRNNTQLDCCMQTLRELSVSWGPPLRYWQTLNRILSRESSTMTANGQDAAPSAGLETPSVGTLPEPADKEPPSYCPGETSGTASSGGALDMSMAGAERIWSDDATSHLFTEVGYLNVGAFDALSWDHHMNQDVPDFHLWGPENAW